MKYLFLFLVFFFMAPGFAEAIEVPTPKVKPASVQKFCREAIAYKQPVGVEYRAGVDDVVPADLGAPLKTELPVIELPVDIDLIDYFNLDVTKLPDGIELKPEVAKISLHPDGRVFYNDQEIADNVEILCHE